MSKEVEDKTDAGKQGNVSIIRHDPALRLQDFKPGRPVPGTGSVEWLIEERERERSGKKYRS